MELNEAAGFSAKFDENHDVSSDSGDDSESSEHEDDQLPKRNKYERQIEQKELPPKPKRFKMVGLDSNHDFRSFVPGDEYEQNPAKKV